MTGEIRIIPLEGIPEVEEGDDLVALLADAAERAGGLEDADVLVVAQKVVSKAEGRVVRMDEIEPSERALELADDRDPRHVEAILQESAQVVRVRPPLIITETRHGFICASAGVDASNAKGEGTLVLLPLDPDASAAGIREGLRERLGRDVGVIVERLVRQAVPSGDDRRRARGLRGSRRSSTSEASATASATSSRPRRSPSPTSSRALRSS